MLKSEQRRELAGVGLIALALLTLLALIPVGALGSFGVGRFESENVMGPLGRLIQSGAVYMFGVAAGLLPFLVGLLGVHLGGWMDQDRTIRLAALSGGLLGLVPAAAQLTSPDGSGPGWLGRAVGRPLIAAAEPFGAGFILVAIFVLLILATLGWNPVRRPAIWAWGGALAGWRGLADWLEGRRFPLARHDPTGPSADSISPSDGFAEIDSEGTQGGAPSERAEHGTAQERRKRKKKRILPPRPQGPDRAR